MNEATSPPPGPPGASTAVDADPADQQSHDEHAHHDARTGIDTDGLRDYRALRRDVHDRKIAGVSGGLARHLDIDPTLVRVVMVVLALFGGAGLILYAALWLFVPEDGSERALIPVGEGSRNAVIVIALVLALLIALPSGLDGDGGAFIGLLILGGVVAAVLLTRDSARRDQTTGGTAQPGGSASGYGSAPPAAGPSWSSSVTIPPAPGAPVATGWEPTPRSARRRGPLLFGIAVASVALALGILGLVDVTGESVPDAAYPALALAVAGSWLVVGAFWGRPGGLVLLGVVSLAALSVAQIAEPTFQGDRDLVVRPTTAADLAQSYDVPAGSVEIDLTRISDLEDLDGQALEVDLNAGEIVLIVPDDLTVDLDAHVSGGGEISTLGSSQGGWDTELQQRLTSDDSRATMDIDLGVGLGRIDVRSE